MKKFAFLLVTIVEAASAHAQNSVTLYGIIDQGFILNQNAAGSRQYQMVSGVLSGSRFGLRGTEDLGGGLHAMFWLENGFNAGTGALGNGGLLFGRQAVVGLVSDKWGTVTLGRQYDSSVEYVAPLTPTSQWAGYLVTNPGDVEDYSVANHVNNSIKYASPKYAGFSFGGLYSLGGVAGNFTENQIYSIGARYTNGSLIVGAAYLNIRNPNASFYATSRGGTAATNNFYTPINSGFASAKMLSVADVAVNYTISGLTFGANYSNAQFSGMNGTVSTLNPAGLVGTVTVNDAAVNFKWAVNPALVFGAQISHSRTSSINGASGGKYNQFDIGATYSLSKRTSFYATAVYQKASGTQSTGTPAVASIFGLTPSSTDRQAAFRVAIRHTF
ncbi:porin [Caballeronia sp. LP003]|uniref:porin n=1 Tax=Caballeronia sp. LP003 TaxID=3038551 RepID=UPI002854859C|nr:porin [Caballeronia sp. LP003]MDR5785497.1 porin [Caballeronia sp. LP003]